MHGGCPVGGSDLPRAMAWEGDTFGLVVRPAYRELWERTAPVADFFFSDTSLEFEVMATLAVDALALNYRLGKFEASLLGLLDTQNVQHVLAAMIDLERIRTYLDERKKKAEPVS